MQALRDKWHSLKDSAIKKSVLETHIVWEETEEAVTWEVNAHTRIHAWDIGSLNQVYGEMMRKYRMIGFWE